MYKNVLVTTSLGCFSSRPNGFCMIIHDEKRPPMEYILKYNRPACSNVFSIIPRAENKIIYWGENFSDLDILWTALKMWWLTGIHKRIAWISPRSTFLVSQRWVRMAHSANIFFSKFSLFFVFRQVSILKKFKKNPSTIFYCFRH